MSNTSSNLRPEGTILRKSTKQAPPRQSFDPLAYQMQGLAEPPQNQLPPNQTAVYQSTPARNQRNFNANNATATTVPQGMARGSTGVSGKSTKQAPPRQSFDPLAYPMQGLTEPPQNEVPPNQAAVYQSTPARNQGNVNANNATATTVPQGMAQSSLGQSYRTGVSGKSTKQAPPRHSFDPLAYQMQGLAHPPQNQVPPNQAAVYQSTPARNQRNVNSNNATATTVPQGMAQSSLDQSYRPGVSGKSTKQAPTRQSFDPLAYQMQGLAQPPQNQVPPNQAAVYQSAPARNQQNVHANATATVPQGMAQASPGQSYRTGAPLQAPQPKQAYAFGDLTKGVVNKGKKADGRNEQSGYKFGMWIANRITV